MMPSIEAETSAALLLKAVIVIMSDDISGLMNQFLVVNTDCDCELILSGCLDGYDDICLV